MRDFTNYFIFKDWLKEDKDTGEEDWEPKAIEILGLKPDAPPEIVRAFEEHVKETERAKKHGKLL